MATNLAGTAALGGGAASTLGSSINNSPLSGVSSMLSGGISTLTNSGTNLLNRFFPPERRADLQARLMKFASEKPHFASFLLSQIALSGLPVAFFITFTVAVAIFALLAALLVAVLGSVLFIVFMAGVALLVLLPTLFVTTLGATFVWMWGTGLYYLIKWFNDKPVPGIHKPLKDGIMESTGLNAIHGGFNDPFTDHKMPPAHEQDPSKRQGHRSTDNKSNDNDDEETTTDQASTNADTKPHPQQKKPRPLSEKPNGATNKPPRTDSPAGSKPSAHSTAKSPSIGDVGSDVKKRTGGALGSVPGTNQLGIAA